MGPHDLEEQYQFVVLLKKRAKYLMGLCKYREAEAVCTEAIQFLEDHGLLSTLEGQEHHVALLLNRAKARCALKHVVEAATDCTEAIQFQEQHELLRTRRGKYLHVCLLFERARIHGTPFGCETKAIVDCTTAIEFQKKHNLLRVRRHQHLYAALLLRRASETKWLDDEAVINDCTTAIEFQGKHNLLRTREGRLRQVDLLVRRAKSFLLSCPDKAAADIKDASECLKRYGLARTREGKLRHVDVLAIRARESETDDPEMTLSLYTEATEFQEQHGLFHALFEEYKFHASYSYLVTIRIWVCAEVQGAAKAVKLCSAALNFSKQHHLRYDHLLDVGWFFNLKVGNMEEAKNYWIEDTRFEKTGKRIEGFYMCFLRHRADAHRTLGHYVEAESDYTRVIEFQRRRDLLCTEVDKRDYVRLLLGRTIVRIELGGIHEAYLDCLAGIDFQDQHDLLGCINHKDLRSDLLRCQGNAHRLLGHLIEAEADYTAAINFNIQHHLHRDVSTKQPLHQLDILVSRGEVRFDLGLTNAAWTDRQQVVRALLFFWRRRGPWWPTHVSAISRWDHEHPQLLGVAYAPLVDAWLRRLSAERSGYTQDAERVQFHRFMQRYLALAHAQGRVDLLPRILAVLHGRKLLEILLADLDDTAADAGLPDAQIQTRKQLRQLRAEIEAIRTQLGRGSGDVSEGFTEPSTRSMVGELSTASVRMANGSLQSQLDERMDALQALIKTDPDLAQITGTVQITPRILRERLTPGQALVILQHQDTDAAGQGTVVAHVLLAAIAGDGFALSFPDLAGLSQRLLPARSLPCLKGQAEQVPQREGAFGLADPPTGEADDLPGTTAALYAYEARVRTDFWDRLREDLLAQGVAPAALDAIQTWHVAITGPLFTLPWAESAPAGVDCVVHSALPFFLKPADTVTPLVPVALSTCAGEESVRTVISAVFLETALLRRLWATEPEDARACIESHRAVGMAHFSCHGTHDEQDPVHSHLWLKDAKGTSGRWETGQVMRSRATPHTAVLSACLAGRSTADAEGDPMGLASALMLRNTCQVVGALVSVPDGAMAWFAVLLQWHVTQGRTVRQALGLTQRAFREAAWPEEFVGFLDQQLPAAMAEALGQLQAVLVAHNCSVGPRREVVERFILELVPDQTVSMLSFRVPAEPVALHPERALATAAGRQPLAATLTDIIVQALRSPDPARYPDRFRQLPFFVRAFGA